MKVLFISRRFYPDITGGGQISAYHIAKAVKSLGHDVYVLTFTTSGYKEEDLDGIKVFRYPILYVNIPLISHFLNLEGMYLQMAYRAWRFTGRIKPDVVHLLNIESIYLTSWILRIKRIPSFATINDPCLCSVGDCVDHSGKSCLECCPSKAFACLMKKRGTPRGFGYLKRFLGSIYQVIHCWELKSSAKQVTELFPVSRAIERLFLKNGFDGSRLKVIRNPVPIKDKTRTDLGRRLGISGKKVILYAGRVTAEKGVHLMVEAMKYIEDAVFLVVGKGSYKNVHTRYYEHLEELVRRDNLEGKVVFAGFVEHRDMGDYYSISDLLVLPGTYYEPLSRMLLEAESYGIPVVASDVGGNSEIVDDGRCGILLKAQDAVELAGAVKRIFGNHEVYEEMSDHCREKIIKEFSPEKVGQDLVEEYGKYLASH